MVVEMAIKGGRDDGNIGVCLLHAGHALGCGEQAQKADIIGPCRFQKVNRRDRGIARGQHRIDDDG